MTPQLDDGDPLQVAVYIVGSMYICLDLCDPEGFCLDRACEVYLAGRCGVCVCVWVHGPRYCTYRASSVPSTPTYEATARHVPGDSNLTRV